LVRLRLQDLVQGSHQVFRHAAFAARQASGAVHGQLLGIGARTLLRELDVGVLHLVVELGGLLLGVRHGLGRSGTRGCPLILGHGLHLLVAVLLVVLVILIVHFDNSKI